MTHGIEDPDGTGYAAWTKSKDGEEIVLTMQMEHDDRLVRQLLSSCHCPRVDGCLLVDETSQPTKEKDGLGMSEKQNGLILSGDVFCSVPEVEEYPSTGLYDVDAVKRIGAMAYTCTLCTLNPELIQRIHTLQNLFLGH